MKHNDTKPAWLKVRACGSARYIEVQALLKQHNLHTVCQEANCPNRGDCFSRGTATFLIMGPNCTRNCRFCNVTFGRAMPLDKDEPANIARAVEILGLKYVVITSVTRDDLPDGGAMHFSNVISAIRDSRRDVKIEVLTPDFQSDKEALKTVFTAGPDIFNHNIETIPRLYSQIRPAADYRRSLAVLRMAADFGGMAVKSGIMVGLGESVDELSEVFDDLQMAGIELLTIGQYLAPSKNHYPVKKYYSPEEFERLAEIARHCRIKSVFSGPLVRSSYHADEQYGAPLTE
jgi:lipoic acid synthetase